MSSETLPAEILHTERLRLRLWKAEDREPFARMNADPRVREYFPGTLTPAESAASISRFEQSYAAHGFSFLAVEDAAGAFLGFCGLTVTPFQAAFTPAVEIGWRFAHEYWGCGYAPEAARAVLVWAFDGLRLQEVVAFTAAVNQRSIRVMEKIGMLRDLAGDFDHPDVPDGR